MLDGAARLRQYVLRHALINPALGLLAGFADGRRGDDHGQVGLRAARAPRDRRLRWRRCIVFQQFLELPQHDDVGAGRRGVDAGPPCFLGFRGLLQSGERAALDDVRAEVVRRARDGAFGLLQSASV